MLLILYYQKFVNVYYFLQLNRIVIKYGMVVNDTSINFYIAYFYER